MRIDPNTTDPAPRRAVILAAGRGSRLRRADPAVALTPEQERIAEQGLKALLPLAGRTLLDFVLEDLAAAGIAGACLVIGSDQHALRQAVLSRRPRPPGLEIAVQRHPLGTADALLAAERFTGGEAFLVVNSDNLYPVGDIELLRRLPGPGLLAFEAAALVDDPWSNIDTQRLGGFALVELDSDGTLRRIVEKPPVERFADRTRPALVGLNCWRFSPRIFEACRAVGRSPRGELELPDAVEHAIRHLGERFEAIVSPGPVLDLSRRADIPAVADRLARRTPRE